MFTRLLLILLLLPASTWAAPLNVFVSVLPLQTFVEAIGGEHVDVHTMVMPGRSPATYDPSPQQISALSQAKLYVRIGVPFEMHWMKRIRSANQEMTVVDARDGIELRKLDDHGHDDHGHGHANEHDPHIWTSPVLALKIAANIRDALIAEDAVHAQSYRDNYRLFAGRLNALDAELRTLFAKTPGLKFMVFHPSWGYFAEAYGLHQVAIEKEGKQPGARALAALVEQARAENIRVVFVQPQFDQHMAEKIAEAIGGKVIAIDPLAADYINNLRAAATQITASQAQ